MRNLFIFSSLFLSSAALAHPNGTYKIDNDAAVTVTFAVVGRCPINDGALSGSLRTLTFSEAATLTPYEFVTGNYVEIHEGTQEIYVNTDDQCVPTRDGARIPASRNTFDGYALQRQ